MYAVVRAHAAPDHTLIERLWSWIPGGAAQAAAGPVPFSVDWAYQVDPLSSVMILVVTFVGFFIHVYSIGYMKHDAGYARYMAYLNLFMFAMLTLVLGANYLVLFVGWEGVGLCSYLLIGFWFHKQSAADAGKKAFIVNRIGDAGFALGMFLIFFTFGTLDFRPVMEAAARLPVEWSWSGPLTMIALFLFIGACGKSAQIPLYVWLPDAMEGPTPVSALIHAATMVTAGVYMVARSSVIYAHAPNALFVVAVVGALTAVMAATIALVQNDIKRVLAYSTVSQLGYMFLACGVGAFAAGVFHLMTHAFFKALLFLGSGSVIHAMGGEQDMRHMGGLKSKLPWTHRTMLIGCIAIAGVPPLAGFFSKDEILWSAFKIGGLRADRVADGLRGGGADRVLHVPDVPPDVQRHVPGHGGAGAPPPRVARLHDRAAAGPGRRLAAGRAGGHPRGDRAPDPRGQLLRALAGAGVRAGAAGPGRGVLAAGPGARDGMGADGRERAGRPGRHRRGLALLPAAPGDPRAAGLEPGRTAPAALEQVLRGRDLRRAVRARPGPGRAGASSTPPTAILVDGGDGEVRPGLGVNGVAWITRDIVARFSDVWDRYVVDGILVKLTAAVLANGSYVFRAVQNGLVQQYALAMLIGVFLLIGAGGFLLGLY